MIPKVLQEVADYLIESDFQLVSTGQDARQDSNQSETKIVQLLQNSEHNEDWTVYSPNIARRDNRAWYDAKIKDYYVDIKISECTRNDNTNAKMAIYYFITGKTPDNTQVRENIFFRDMKHYENPDENRDYYYLIVNKNNLNDIFVVSLKGLNHAFPSHNNMPFQSNWDKCRNPVNRNWQEAKEFLLSTWAEAITKCIEKYSEGMLRYYPEFFEKFENEKTRF